MSVTDSQRDLISVQVRPVMRMMRMMPWMMVMMLPRSVAPLEEAWEELLARWARTGTGSCGGDLYAGHSQLTIHDFASQLNLFQLAVEPWPDCGPRGCVKQNSSRTHGEHPETQKSRTIFSLQASSSSSSSPSVCMTEGCVGKQPNSLSSHE